MSIRLIVPFSIDHAQQELDRKKQEVKHDCFFHRTGNDMSALYDHCDLIEGLEYDECPCYKCNCYISKGDAIDLIKKEVLKNEKEQQ